MAKRFVPFTTTGTPVCMWRTIIAYEPVKIDFPFEVEDVENVEMYHYDGVPASAES